MNLWRVEIARLVRTSRWMILFGVYAAFGALGPATARYLGEIMERFGGEVEIVLPDPQPIDGIAQYVSNASQIGILAVVVVGAGALAIDARPDLAAFYRTRVGSIWELLRPRYVVALAAASLATVIGTAIAAVGSETLIGEVDHGAVALGTIIGLGYLGFVLALTAAMASVTRTTVTTVFAVIAVALLLPVVGLVGVVKPWLPSELVIAPLHVAAGGAATEFLRSLAVSVAASAALLALATRRFAAREL